MEITEESFNSTIASCKIADSVFEAAKVAYESDPAVAARESMMETLRNFCDQFSEWDDDSQTIESVSNIVVKDGLIRWTSHASKWNRKTVPISCLGMTLEQIRKHDQDVKSAVAIERSRLLRNRLNLEGILRKYMESAESCRSVGAAVPPELQAAITSTSSELEGILSRKEVSLADLWLHTYVQE